MSHRHVHSRSALTSFTDQQQQQRSTLSVVMASLVFLLFLLYEASSEPVVIPVKPGENVTLQCDAGEVTITAVEWTRSDLVAPEYVLYYSDGYYDQTHQNSSFKGRVQLMDGELKNGDVSLILKDVSGDDVGTYECRVATAGSGRNKRALNIDPITRVHLQVTGDQNGPNNNGPNNNRPNNNRPNNNSTPLHVGLVGLVAVVLVCSAAVGFFLVRKFKRQRDDKPELSAAEETGGYNLI